MIKVVDECRNVRRPNRHEKCNFKSIIISKRMRANNVHVILMIYVLFN